MYVEYQTRQLGAQCVLSTGHAMERFPVNKELCRIIQNKARPGEGEIESILGLGNGEGQVSWPGTGMDLVGDNSKETAEC